MSRDPIVYQHIFDLLNANSRTPKGSILSERLNVILSQPESTFQLFNDIRKHGNPALFSFHKSSYLRAAKKALNLTTWNPEHVPALVELTNWLISLGMNNKHYSTEIRSFVDDLEKKLPISEEQKQQWARVLPSKTRIFAFTIQPPKVTFAFRPSVPNSSTRSYNNYDRG